MTVSELSVKVSADTREAESGLSSLGSKIGSVGTGLATAFGAAAIGGIAALGAGLAASAASAAGFEKQMSSIKAVSGATAGEIGQLSDLALQLGADTAFSATEAAQGIEELIKAGVSIGDVMGGGAAAALNLAAAGGLSVAESAEIAANAMNVFSLSGADVGHVADVIAGAANASAIDVHDFGMSLAAAGSVAATVGIGFDDLGTAIAVMGQAGIKGSDAGTSLKTMLLNLTPSTKSQIAVAKELGIITADGANRFFDATGKAKSLSEISGVLKEVTSDLTEQQKLQALQTLFGTDAIRAAAIMAKAGSEGFNEMAESIGKVTAEAVAQERLNNLAGVWDNFTGSVETAAIKLGSWLLPGLQELVEWGDETVSSLIPNIDQVGMVLSSQFLDAIAKAKDGARQLGDAWRTVQQVFEGKWEPSAQIDPFVNAVGQATLKIKELVDWMGKVGGKAADMGALKNVDASLSSMAKNAGSLQEQLSGLSGAIERLGTVSLGSEKGINLVALGVTHLTGQLRLGVIALGEFANTLVFGMRVVGDWNTATIAAAKGFAAFLSGNQSAMNDAKREFDAAVKDAGQALETWTRNLDRNMQDAKASMKDMATAGTQAAMAEHKRAIDRAAADTGNAAQMLEANWVAGLDGMTAATASSGSLVGSSLESSMASATAAVEGGAATLPPAMETGMTGVVGAVEAQAPVAVAAAEAMGTGMAGGIEAAAPQMTAAAEAGASGAVAAVQGQTGAASSAGQSLGEALGSGLEGGIGAYVGRVASAAARLVSAAIGAARAEAQAESPSKKTQKLGEDMAEGLEIGLNKSQLGEEMKARIRDFIAASREYIPTAGEIARVEEEIKRIREEGQTAALFRAEEMITLDSEMLRLKEAQVRIDRDAVGLRQDLAAASREIADAERGSLTERTTLIQYDAQRKQLRLQTLDLEKKIIEAGNDPARRKALQEQIDKLRDQDRLLGIEAERIQTTNSLAATAARVRREGLDDQVRGVDSVITAIKNQIEVLGAERAVFDANEAVIKNATENEIAYRNRLIEVFKSEALPLTDRIKAGLALVAQLEKEGAISKELADKLRQEAAAAGIAASATTQIGNAADGAAGQIGEAARRVDALSSSLGRLPSWFRPTGGGGSSRNILGFASGGILNEPVIGVGASGRAYSFAERGPEAIIPADVTRSWMGGYGGGGGGAPQVIRLDVAVGGQVAKQIVIEGYDLAVRRGWTPGGLTG